MKKAVSLLVVIIMLFSLSACSGGIKGDEAKAYINDFFNAIEAGDHGSAATFLHPDRPIDLKVLFERLQNENSLDFSNIEVDRYTGFSCAYYDSTVNGSEYSLRMDTIVSGKNVQLEIQIVKNDNGYGIYNIEIDP